jgi:hypothetical protein
MFCCYAILKENDFKKVWIKDQKYVKLNGKSEKKMLENCTTTPTLPFKQQQNVAQSHETEQCFGVT